MPTKYNRRRTRKTRSRKYGGELTQSIKDMLREKYEGKPSPTIIELREFLDSKEINPTGWMHEVIQHVIRLTGSPLSPVSPEPPKAIPKKGDSNYGSFMQDMMRSR
jgi:hypothetical protein